MFYTADSEIEMDLSGHAAKSQTGNRQNWTKKESAKLEQLVETYGPKWIEIATHFEGRNPSQCAQRWKRMKPKQFFQNQKWSQAEDENLLVLTEIHQNDWPLIASKMENRTARQVRERFLNVLNPNINKKSWSEKEDEQIWKLYLKFGTKWTKISKRFRGRPENMIKNRFYSHVRQKFGELTNPYYVKQSSKTRLITEEASMMCTQNESRLCEQRQMIEEELLKAKKLISIEGSIQEKDTKDSMIVSEMDDEGEQNGSLSYYEPKELGRIFCPRHNNIAQSKEKDALDIDQFFRDFNCSWGQDYSECSLELTYECE